MPKMSASRRDPAPSRLSYRLTRMALTPLFRRLFFLGLPAMAFGTIAGFTLADPKNRDAISIWYNETKTAIQSREEFMVRLMSIEGASDGVAEDIREILPIDFPLSSFDLDLDAMQVEVAALDAVARADLRIRSGGVLEISVLERVPAIMWRSAEGLELLDATGMRVAEVAHRTARPDLPLITGQGADRAVPEALALLVAAAPLEERVRGLVRMGERRWDLVLDQDQNVLLPEIAPVSALEQVIALQQAQDVLARDVLSVDMRNPNRPTLRLNDVSARALRKAKMIQLGDK